MLKHIVCFKLRGTEEERKDTAEKFKSALVTLPGQIESLKAIEVGINVNPDERWDVVLVALVENFEGLVNYSQHPLHLEAVKIIAPYKEDRACVDFYV